MGDTASAPRPSSPSGPLFHFWGCSEIRESLALRAESEHELLERLETVPAESLYHHTVRCLLRRQVVTGGFYDDISAWVASEIGDLTLAEKLALPSPFDFADVEAFRAYLLDVLDDHLSELPFNPRIILASPFYFCRGHLAAVPLDIEVDDLPSFRRALTQVDESSIYFHAVEAIGRLGNPRGDFAAWVEDGLGLSELARKLRETDVFVLSLSRSRGRFLELIDEELKGGAR